MRRRGRASTGELRETHATLVRTPVPLRGSGARVRPQGAKGARNLATERASAGKDRRKLRGERASNPSLIARLPRLVVDPVHPVEHPARSVTDPAHALAYIANLVRYEYAAVENRRRSTTDKVTTVHFTMGSVPEDCRLATYNESSILCSCRVARKLHGSARYEWVSINDVSIFIVLRAVFVHHECVSFSDPSCLILNP